MDTPDNTTIPIKRCSKGAACIHPEGPNLPATAKCYYRDRNRADGFRAECKACNSKMLGVTPRPVYDVPEGYRRCGNGDKCLTPGGPVLPATEEHFFRDNRKPGGLHSKCKTCHMQETRRWQSTYPERTKEISRRSRQRNAETINQQRRARRSAHPGGERAKRHRREARKQALPATFTDADWRYALEYFHGTCAYCGNPPRLFDLNWVLHHEHHIPLARGGAYTPNNIVPACQDCNFSKSDRDPHEWIIWRFKQKAREITQRLSAFFATVRHDTPASIARSHLPWSEKAAARRTELRANLPATKRCRGEADCMNPDGPDQPLTLEFFGPNNKTPDGFEYRCRMCERARINALNKRKTWRHVED